MVPQDFSPNHSSRHDWYHLSEEEALRAHQISSTTGLNHNEAIERLAEFGHNKIKDSQKKTIFQLLLSQFSDLFVLVLLASALIALFLGEPQDTIAIFAIVILNATLGFIQEYRAEKAIEALQSLAAPLAKVKREGEVLTIPAWQLVPGDIVLLEAGNIVPADLRLIEVAQLSTNESALTGESQAVHKISGAIESPITTTTNTTDGIDTTNGIDTKDGIDTTNDRVDTKALAATAPSLTKLALHEQLNMAFKGTTIATGRAEGLVIKTGMQTELGKIAKLLESEIEVKTPLQNRIAQFAKTLTLVVVLLCAFIFLIGLWRGENPLRMFLTAISLAVAAIPEALPAVVTMGLALGAKALSRKQSLIRKLPAVESLGSVTTIATDKTGTLTQNKMEAQEFFINNDFYLEPPSNWSTLPVWQWCARVMTLNNDVQVGPQNSLQGDPTEVALLEWAQNRGFNKKSLSQKFPRIAELPFSSERSRMSTLHQFSPAHSQGAPQDDLGVSPQSDLREESHGELPKEWQCDTTGGFLLIKGSPEKILPLCTHQMSQSLDTDTDTDTSLRPSPLELINHAVHHMAERGYRVLALAQRSFSEDPTNLDLKDLEKNLCFIGLVGIIDPPREEVRAAISSCQSAGIHIVMLTGDHPTTAQVIARQLGILTPSSPRVMTGKELMDIPETEFIPIVKTISVYARVVPEQKIRIIKALQASGEIVAMTGDGVNDAPALKRADVGIAMGRGGTDVAREAAHIILLDDNFSSIVLAVREGRRVYDNIRKFIRFVLAGNAGEIWTLTLAPLLGLPLPLLPIHILWVNLVTDGLPGLALALEPEEKNIMQRPPRPPQEVVFDRPLLFHSLWVGGLIGILTLSLAAWAYHHKTTHWQSMAFTTLTLAQMGLIFATRSNKNSLWQIGLFSNRPLLFAVTLTFLLQLMTLYVPALNRIFKTQPLSIKELLLCLGSSVIVYIAVEVQKLFSKNREK